MLGSSRFALESWALDGLQLALSWHPSQLVMQLLLKLEGEEEEEDT